MASRFDQSFPVHSVCCTRIFFRGTIRGKWPPQPTTTAAASHCSSHSSSNLLAFFGVAIAEYDAEYGAEYSAAIAEYGAEYGVATGSTCRDRECSRTFAACRWQHHRSFTISTFKRYPECCRLRCCKFCAVLLPPHFVYCCLFTPCTAASTLLCTGVSSRRVPPTACCHLPLKLSGQEHADEDDCDETVALETAGASAGGRGVCLEDFEIIRIIGKGGQGQVAQAIKLCKPPPQQLPTLTSAPVPQHPHLTVSNYHLALSSYASPSVPLAPAIYLLSLYTLSHCLCSSAHSPLILAGWSNDCDAPGETHHEQEDVRNEELFRWRQAQISGTQP